MQTLYNNRLILRMVLNNCALINMIMIHKKIPSLLLASLSVASFTVAAEHIEPAIDIGAQINQAAVQSQDKIDRLSDKTRQMLDQYRSAKHQAETLSAYNDHLQTLLESQKQEKEDLQQQLMEIENTQTEIIPLVLRMLDSLEKFIELDLPFLPQERQERLNKLKDMMARADVSIAEKYRRILEAYQIENEYGNTIEAYRDDLTLNDVTGSVDFLRLGRVALFYQRLDGSESGYWNQEKQQWQVLSEKYRIPIQNGLKIARQETAPDLLILPVSAAETAQ